MRGIEILWLCQNSAWQWSRKQADEFQLVMADEGSGILIWKADPDACQRQRLSNAGNGPSVLKVGSEGTLREALLLSWMKS